MCVSPHVVFLLLYTNLLSFPLPSLLPPVLAPPVSLLPPRFTQPKASILARRAAALQWHESSATVSPTGSTTNGANGANGADSTNNANDATSANGVNGNDADPWWRRLPALRYEEDTTVTLGPLEIKTFVVQL